MKLKALWIDGVEQEWEVSPMLYGCCGISELRDYIDFIGKKIQPEGIKSDTIERQVIIPLKNIRWFEVTK